MLNKPLIGLNADFRAATKDAPAFSYVCAGYYDGLIASDAVPVIVPPMSDDESIDRVLDTLDGFVLVGGADLDPRNDGFMMHPSIRPLDPRREAFDRKLARRIGERRMPVLAIGTGMQVLNVERGGSLFLHVPEDLPKALPHKDPLDPAHRHALEVVPGTLMERIYGDGEIRVNSMHHMALDDVAADFVVAAQSPDGVVEAIESADPQSWFVVGTQFHPEAESSTALDIRIFEEFVDGVKQPHTELRLVA